MGERWRIGLEAGGWSGLTAVNMALSTPPNVLLDSLAGYPRWFVAACATIVLAVALWIFAKLLKWSLYLLIALVVIGGLAATGWLMFN